MTKSGIYLVQPAKSELNIIYNPNDAERAGDKSSILKGNKEKFNFGQSNKFENSSEESKGIFGSDVRFLKVLEINDIEKLTEFKKHLKNVFNQYCLISLKDGRKMDWMKSITLNNSQNIILEEYKKFNENL